MGFFITIMSFYIPKLLNEMEPAVKQYEKAIDSKNSETDTSVIDTASSVENSCIEKTILDLKGSKLLQTERLNDLTTKNTIQWWTGVTNQQAEMINST